MTMDLPADRTTAPATPLPPELEALRAAVLDAVAASEKRIAILISGPAGILERLTAVELETSGTSRAFADLNDHHTAIRGELAQIKAVARQAVTEALKVHDHDRKIAKLERDVQAIKIGIGVDD